MKNSAFIRTSALLALSSLSLVACGGGGDPTPIPKDLAVDLHFVAHAGDTPVKCGSLVTDLGTANTIAEIKDFRFYIANVALITATGTEVPLQLEAGNEWNLSSGSDRLTLIDLEDGSGKCAGGTAATNASIKGIVPAGTYSGVKMTMGVPFTLNHTLYSDAATAKPPLDIQAMAWSWQAGRKFAKIEVTEPDNPAPAWSAKTFNFHLGSSGCTGNPASGEIVSCAAENRMSFTLNDFDFSRQNIAFDLRALLAGENITVNEAGASGCMSGGTDPECDTLFNVMRIDWQADGSGNGKPIANGSGQTLFRAVAK